MRIALMTVYPSNLILLAVQVKSVTAENSLAESKSYIVLIHKLLIRVLHHSY
ncbi:hypothetical protein D3C75_1359650 [compost metagenome]